ncbi:hypothetical protein Gotri_004621 [Gossypium trilobum]|uniref:Uncharacterized protein n=1 Tax=Gossypium trilobum TaxID=34281 RepID=A0A7J9F5E7_9ROSI|nr:hypothetical protein [Gossypium trilobum]
MRHRQRAYLISKPQRFMRFKHLRRG